MIQFIIDNNSSFLQRIHHKALSSIIDFNEKLCFICPVVVIKCKLKVKIYRIIRRDNKYRAHNEDKLTTTPNVDIALRQSIGMLIGKRVSGCDEIRKKL